VVGFVQESFNMHESHRLGARQYELAGHSHRTVHNGKGEYSDMIRQAHAKSGQMVTR
jgi:hypothetical protein